MHQRRHFNMSGKTEKKKRNGYYCSVSCISSLHEKNITINKRVNKKKDSRAYCTHGRIVKHILA